MNAAMMRSPVDLQLSDLFLAACEMDVTAFKPGNVSRESPGHGMTAEDFLASAEAAAPHVTDPDLEIGERIYRAIEATRATVDCNTNLGIVLLAAPIAQAFELASKPGREPASQPLPHAPAWRLPAALEAVLAELDLNDARAVYRAIAMANPGGLGSAPAQDVHAEPSLPLRAAMALAAGRDTIARIYRDGYAPLLAEARVLAAATAGDAPQAEVHAAVQALYLRLLARWPDSHIVRKHGEAVAQNVMAAAQAFEQRASRGELLAHDAGFHLWDAELKAQRINPGTTADLCVAVLMLALLRRGTAAVASATASVARWHGT